MNDLNELELQLRSWVLRRPSARLKRRLFRRRPVSDDTPEPSFRLSWLPPATAALLLLCVLFNQHSSQALSSAGANPIVALALSNQSVVAWLPASCEHNRLPTGTFEWTNDSRSTSGIGSHSVSSGTN